MGANRIDLGQEQKTSGKDVSGLKSNLAQLVGEPFRFARVSYGDELALHFGELRPARSPKLRGRSYGAYILGLRGSPWILKSGSESVVLTAGEMFDPPPPQFGIPLRKEELESGSFIEPESRVLGATPFVVKPVDGFGLELRLSDGSTLLVLPTVQMQDGPEEEGLPELADWELSSPRGLLSAGPGLEWSFKPSENKSPDPPPSIEEIVALFDRIGAFQSSAELLAFSSQMKAQQYARMLEYEDEESGMRIKRLWSFHDQVKGSRLYADILELPADERKRLIRQYSRFLKQIRAVRKAMADYFAGQRFFEFYGNGPAEAEAEFELALKGLDEGDILFKSRKANQSGDILFSD